jgi:acetyl-CoA carboxylase carboxyltransferase component
MPMQNFRSKVNTKGDRFLRNKEEMQVLVDQLNTHLAVAKKEGSDASIERARKRKKFLARERIQLLLDKDSPFIELMPLAGMLHQGGFGPGGTTVASIGYVNKRLCIVNANLSARKAGAVDYATSLKIKRLGDIAMENKIPTINLVESGGANLPDQDRVFNNYGATFRQMSLRSKQGIPTISVVFGNATAGGAYVPGMSDYTIMQKDTAKVFLAGPPLVKMATNEETNAEELGGAAMHSRISGVADFLADDEMDAINIARNVIKTLKPARPHFEPPKPIVPPRYKAEELLGIVPANLKKPVDVREVITRIVDGSEFTEFKENYGITMVCCWAKIEGYPVGIIASNGVIFAESAQKATQFIQLANKSNLPLLFIHNTTGFMVGKSYEQNGMINSGSQMIHAVAGSTVPHISLLIGNSYGAGNYAMCGRSFSPRFLFAYPNAKAGVMGAEQLSGVMEIIKRQSAASMNKEVDEKQLKQEKEAIKKDAELKASVWHATSELWDDGVIDPRDTRKHIGIALATVYQSPIEGSDHFGVFRM